MQIKSNKFVIQKYIEKPLLYENKKFDIRFYILVTPNTKLYYCKDMYIRLSAFDYNLNDTRKFGHLTNIALQKYSQNYDEEKAIINKKALESYIKKTLKPDFDFDQDIFPKIKQIVCILGAVILKKFLVFTSTKKNFEIFGLDFMIDHELKVWFIEVNTNPAITLGNTFIDQLIPRMLDDAFKLTIDRQFPMPSSKNQSSNFMSSKEIQDIRKTYRKTVYKMEGFDDNESIWERISEKEIEASLESHPN
jgi:hypothetical protein